MAEKRTTQVGVERRGTGAISNAILFFLIRENPCHPWPSLCIGARPALRNPRFLPPISGTSLQREEAPLCTAIEFFVVPMVPSPAELRYIPDGP
jgi:hypothetical protein